MIYYLSKSKYRVYLAALFLFHDLTITGRPNSVIHNSEIILPPCWYFGGYKSIKYERGAFGKEMFTPRFVKNPFSRSIIIRDDIFLFPYYSNAVG